MKVANFKINSITATCPACGLLCDDVLVENNNNKIKVLNTNCQKAITFFEEPFDDATPQINGKPASLQQAISHAAKLIKASQQPLFAGLSTDVAGFRSLYHLSQKTNGSLQHINAASMARNLKVLQSTGWQTTTLTEVKNRADVIVCFGDVTTHNPRFFERFVDVDGMFISAKQRKIIFIGGNIQKADAPAGAWVLACRPALESSSPVAIDLPDITLVLRALVAGKTLKATEVAGIKVSDLQIVADVLKTAQYAVLAWVAKDLDFAHAELSIQNITETVTILNNTTRAAGLPLGGSDGDTSANNANTWLSGLALNDDALNNKDLHDLMVWVNSFGSDKQPPKTDKPLIIIGNANIVGAAFSREATFLNDEKLSRLQAAPTNSPTIFIPIATPGLDCSSTLFRVDSAVVLPLKKLRENDLPTLGEVLGVIEALL